MAGPSDISQTPADVLEVSDVKTKVGTAGGTITQGMPLYKNASDKKLYPAVATGADEAECVGIALTASSLDQPVVYATSGIIDVGGTIVKGSMYVVSPLNAGGILLDTDLASGNYISLLGPAVSSTNLLVCLANTGETHG